MKLVKYLTAALVVSALLWTSSLYAQRPLGHKGHKGMRGMNIEQMKADLNLSDEQVQQITSLQEDFRAQMKTLRASETTDQEAKRAEMKKLMKAQKAAVEAILTDEQKKLLEAKKEEHRAARKERLENTDWEALREEVKAYKTANIEPILKGQRSKLEAQLSAEDKATIETIRAEKKNHMVKRGKKRKGMHPPHMRGERSGEKSDRTQRSPEQREKHMEMKATMKALVEKYEADIDALYAEIETEMNQWATDLKAIHEKYISAPGGENHRKRGNHRQDRVKKMSKGHFLLLDPNAQNERAFDFPAAQASTSVKIFPNPATSANTIQYEVKAEGLLRIELHNENGKLLQVVVEDQLRPGQYSNEVDLSAYPNGAYYYTIIDATGISTEKFIISKN